MILSMTFQCRLFFMAIGLGMLGGLVYTFILSVIDTSGRGKILKNICDMFFWLIYAFVIFLTMLCVNYGEIRPFAILGISVGLVLYYSALEKYARRIVRFAIKTAAHIISVMIEIILTPFRILLYPFKKLTNCIKKTCKIAKNMRK